ncbi:hypothetical protein D9M68_851870 [compost metagenome]
MGRALQRQLGHQRAAVLDDVRGQLPVPRRIQALQAGAEYRDGLARHIQGASMGGAVDAQGQAAGDHEAAASQAAGEAVRGIQPGP